MEDYFDKYKEAKISLSKMIGQFYDAYISQEKLNLYGLKYDKDDVIFDKVRCCFHQFTAEGIYTWNILGLKKPIISYKELWKNRDKISLEEKNDTKNYYEEYLKITLIVAYMVEKYYATTIKIEQADKLNLEYDIIDELDNNVDICDHLCEGAGESAWKLLGLEEETIPMSKIRKKQNELKEKLLVLSKK